MPAGALTEETVVILSEAKDLFFRGVGKKQVLRFAQDDNCDLLRDLTLSRRPLQRAPADQVHMQVKNRLAGARAHVQYRAVAIFNRPLPRNLRRCQVAASHQFGVFCRGFLQASDVSFGDDQHVGRALGVQIFKSKRVLIFVNFLGRNFAANNAAE